MLRTSSHLPTVMSPVRSAAPTPGSPLRLCAAIVSSSLLAAVPVACGSPEPTTVADHDRELTGRVIRVVDGDTVVIRVGDRDETVRLIGIDTPETVKPNSPVECHGPEASALTSSLLPVGTRVSVSRDVEPRDDYGRLLAYVHREPDGLFVNLELAATGAARPLTIAPNTAATTALVAASRQAQAAGLGLWGACTR